MDLIFILSGGSMVKNLPAVQESQVWSLVWDDPLEKGMAIHSSILTWESHGRRMLAGYGPWDFPGKSC